jgi:lipopolysaccharide export LptBFGC system permease protein LptF
MRLLDRYLLREFLVPLCYCLSGFLIFWIAFDVFSELRGMQEEGMLVRDIAEYYVFKTPEFLIMVLPVALLLALLYTLTNHARHNEITAIRAAGVSLIRLCLPYFAIGIVATLLLFALDEFCVPRTAEIAEQMHARHNQKFFKGARGQPVKNLVFSKVVSANEKRHWFIGVYNQQTGEMIKLHVDWDFPDKSSRSIDADRAVFTNGVWTFFQVKESRQSAVTNSYPVWIKAAVAAFPEFTETPRQIRSGIIINDEHDHPPQARRADIPVTIIYNFLRLNPQPEASLRPWIYTKLHGRFAGPCACLVVVLVAIPFGAASGRRNVFVGVAASIMLFFAYYVLQQLGFAFGEAGRAPAWLGAWLPNLFFGIGSLWMISRVR